MGITKRGNPYWGSILIRGARSVVSISHRKEDRLSRWVSELKERSHANAAAVALANKTVRVAWAMLRDGTDYEPELMIAWESVNDEEPTNGRHIYDDCMAS